ncbi:MAG: hypothetical protein OEZ14_02660 [Acidimicrobiia bacterium]|nr:hypothetical protein [Acidimicrobiia bacterium]MDH5519414.1 hypothetical protein [Acidimicrobiia bacterium]
MLDRSPAEDALGTKPKVRPVKPSRVPVWLVALVALVAVGWFLAGAPIGTVSDEPTPADRGSAVNVDSRFSTLDAVAVEELPDEARTTLSLIGAGGPYPFSRDNSIFQNRERILPLRDSGHYREYTVITPGEDDRGARRVVAGADGELYYTDDHYSSFREIVGDDS